MSISQLRLLALASVVVILLAPCCIAVPVTIAAMDYVDSSIKIEGLPVVHLESNKTYSTGKGGFIYLDYPVGTNLTFLALKYHDWHEMQTATVMVPPGGMNTTLTQIVLQVPSIIIYDFFNLVTPGHKENSKCQVVVTVCNVNKTAFDRAQGLPNSTVRVTPPLYSKMFYFGTWGKLGNETNPFPNDLNSTSYDGGVLIENIPVQSWDQEYLITAHHPGFTFTSTRVKCNAPGRFINAAPNQGPRASRDGWEMI